MTDTSKKPRCPKCNSENLAIERRPDGNARCLDCGWDGKYFYALDKSQSDNSKKYQSLKEQCEKLEKALEYYSFPENHATQKVFNQDKREFEEGSAVKFCDNSGERARQALEAVRSLEASKIMSELKICDFCKNTGVHLCPDVAEPILIKCSRKQCPIAKFQALEEQNRVLVEALRGAVLYLESTGIQREEYSHEPEHQMFNSFKQALASLKEEK